MKHAIPGLDIAAFRQDLKNHQALNGKSQTQVAREVGISQVHLSYVLNDTRKVTPQVFLKLCSYMGKEPGTYRTPDPDADPVRLAGYLQGLQQPNTTTFPVLCNLSGAPLSQTDQEAQFANITHKGNTKVVRVDTDTSGLVKGSYLACVKGRGKKGQLAVAITRRGNPDQQTLFGRLSGEQMVITSMWGTQTVPVSPAADVYQVVGVLFDA
ncbi:helix-turn-helix domain-containing protein [Ferrimonas marina]|uniref:Helix-turn-helix n=1 Tax=Ferrimonas marina TaxID=299255 RepID=A0A1M5TT66_9GAMM|nr:helix-turn-helix transcriptional regulator [Ferrimonas marina]SHH53914.1 Helix-turn-helix [Ferrimonas marina]